MIDIIYDEKLEGYVIVNVEYKGDELVVTEYISYEVFSSTVSAMMSDTYIRTIDTTLSEMSLDYN